MIRFDDKRMREAKRAHDLWWEGKLGRPLLRLVVKDAYPMRETTAPVLTQANCTDFSYTPEQLIDAFDAQLSCYEFLGDAFPSVSFDCFGPGVLSAFCGAEIRNSTGGVWFFPREELPISEICVKYNPENIYVRRIKAIYRAGLERWGNSVVLSMPDLGGVLDIAATFCGTESLLVDLYDAPGEVTRLISEIEDAWYAAYADLSGALGPDMGHTDWSGLYSTKPSYVLQSDFSYMIGPGMFEEFVLPTLVRDCERLENTLYHLDGAGELPHLDAILSIDRLKAVQWQYGAGQKPVGEWEDVYEKIINGGKLLQIIDNEDEFTSSAEFIRRYGARVYLTSFVPSSLRGAVENLLNIR